MNLDEGWRFIRQDVDGAQESGFSDSKWESINIPHSWNALDGQDGGTNYYRGPGWYRKHFKVDSAYAGRQLFLKFDGAFSVCGSVGQRHSPRRTSRRLRRIRF